MSMERTVKAVWIYPVQRFNDTIARRRYDEAWNDSKRENGWTPQSAFYFWFNSKGNFQTRGYIVEKTLGVDAKGRERHAQYYTKTKREAVEKARQLRIED